MAGDIRNPIQAWLDQSTERERPKDEVHSFTEIMNQPGVETDPFMIGEITLETGLVTVCDHWTVWPEEGVTVAVKPGTYRVFVVGKEFDGERRIARVSLIHASSTAEQVRHENVGEVLVDSWSVMIGEYSAWHAGLSESEQEELGDSQFGKYPDGCELFVLGVGENQVGMVRSFTGFGSGAYPVDAIWEADACIGLCCEFIFEGQT